MQGRGLSLRSVRYTHSIVRKALQDAFRRGLVVRNVADQASPPKTTNTKPPTPQVWTPTQLGEFLAHVEGSNHYPLLATAAMTGMRRGELCGLGWDNVDIEARTLEVVRNLTITNRVLLIGEPKTRRSRRSIDIDARTADVLKARRIQQVERRLAMGEGWQDEHGLVFTMGDGSPWHPQVVSRAFSRLVASTGLPRLSIHGLRHTHATHLLAAGENPKLVSQRLGHSSLAFTLDTYAHLLPGQQAEAAENVAQLIFGT
jgi:integrase